MSTTPQELGRFTADELQVAGLFVRAKVMLDGADQTLLRACIDAHIAAAGLRPQAVDCAILDILRRMQPVDYLQSLRD